MSSDLLVVLGARGGIGQHLVAHLAAEGHRVRAVTRDGADIGGPAVESVGADLATWEGARAATAGASVVFHAAQPAYWRWPQEFGALTARIADGAQAAGARLVVADNLYMYGPSTAPLREDSPQTAAGRKGVVRRTMAATLLARHAAGDLRVTLGRASDYYGPGGLGSSAGEPLFGPLVAGRTARWGGDLDQPHTMHYLPDVARGLAVLGDHTEADGRAWHLPAAEAITGRRFIEIASSAVDVRAKPAVLGANAVRVLGLFNRTIRELGETLPTFQRPHVSDASAFLDAFGAFGVTAHEHAIAVTARWFAQRHSAVPIAA